MELSPQEKGQVDETSQPFLGQTGQEILGAPDAPSTLLATQPQAAALQALLVSQPTWPNSSIRLCYLAVRGTLSQISWLCFSPAGEVPSGASTKSSFLPVGVQAYCASGPGRATHQPTHPINPEVPPLLQGRHRVACPQ